MANFLATCIGLIRLFSRQIVFGIGRKVEVNLRQKLLIICLSKIQNGYKRREVVTLLVELQVMWKT